MAGILEIKAALAMEMAADVHAAMWEKDAAFRNVWRR